MIASILRRCTFIAAALFFAWAGPAAAQGAQQDIVNDARQTVEKLRNDADMAVLNYQLQNAKGVMVFPSLFKAGFIFGVEGGSGVLLAKDARGTWSSPAFYNMGTPSIGLQAGLQQSAVIFVIMTDAGLQKVMANQFKLGFDASIAVGPVGRGVSASTTAAFGADIYSYSNARGLFGGVSFDASIIYARHDWNQAYYAQPVTVQDIVIDNKVANGGANDLRFALATR